MADLPPTTSPDALPACCGALETDWVLPFPLAEAQMSRVSLDPQRFDKGDFALCHIEPPQPLLRAVAKRQAEYLAGRLCARSALKRLGSRSALPSADGRHGPRWPASFCGSISHSKGMAGAVCGRSNRWRSLGLDIEETMNHRRAERLAPEILTPGEQQRFAGLDLDRLTSLAFSLKEALYKALNPLTGRFFYFHDAELLHWEKNGRARLRLLMDLSPQWPAGREIDAQARIDSRLCLSLVAIPANL